MITIIIIITDISIILLLTMNNSGHINKINKLLLHVPDSTKNVLNKAHYKSYIIVIIIIIELDARLLTISREIRDSRLIIRITSRKITTSEIPIE